MRTATRRSLCLAAGLLALLAFAADARAGIVIGNSSVKEIPDPVFQYEFAVYLDVNAIVKNDYFTIYDIPFLDPGTNSQIGPDGLPNALWAATFELVGPTPGDVTVDDDPTLMNVSWRWRGADPLVVGPGGPPLFLGWFYVSTTDDAQWGDIPMTLDASSQTTPDLAHPTVKKGSTQTFQTMVPEPSSLALLAGGGLAGAWMLRSRRRRCAA